MIGIYKITSPTGRIYIGQSVNIERITGVDRKCIALSLNEKYKYSKGKYFKYV